MAGRPCPKATVYRNPALLKLAALAPHCMNPWCRRPQDGSVVAAHSNLTHHGKGMGIKAHDLPAYLCRACHDQVDGRDYIAMQEREILFYESVYETFLWLLQEGHLEVRP